MPPKKERKVKRHIKITDDEKIILKNLIVDNYDYIHRNGNDLYLTMGRWLDGVWLRSGEIINFYLYRHLFQEIKDGEEYEIKELLEEK